MKRAGKAGLVMAVLGAAAFFGTRHTAERTLIKISKPICLAFENHNDQTTERFQWLNSDSILEIVHWRPGHPGEIFEFRFKDKTRNPLENLYEKVKSTGAYPLLLSPDKEWLLCRKGFRKQVTQAGGIVESRTVAHQYFAVNIHDLRVIGWPKIQLPPNGDYYGPMWKSDSSSFVTINGSEALILRLNYPAEMKRIPLSQRPRDFDILAVFPDERAVIVEKGSGEPTDMVILKTVRLSDMSVVLEQHRVALPARCYLNGIAISPDRNRLAWQFHFSDYRMTPVWLLNLLDRLPHSTESKQFPDCIYVSDKDGANMREIGREYHEDISLLGWAPDGKKLAYDMKNMMYTVDTGE